MSPGVCASRWGQEQKSHLGLAGCDKTFSAWSPLHEEGGKSELCHSQSTNPGNLHGGSRGMSKRWILEADFSPNVLHPVVALLKHRQLFFCVSDREEAEGEGRMEGPICLMCLHGFQDVSPSS